MTERSARAARRMSAPPQRLLRIANRQRSRPVDTRLLGHIIQSTLAGPLGVVSWELGVHLVAAAEMARVNQTFLQHEGSTDVITFDHSDTPPTSPAPAPQHLHGEIFISVPDAMAQAREFGTTWQAELVRYVIHGLLHLLGHDDLQPAARRVMKRAENRLVAAVVRAQAVDRLHRRPARAPRQSPARPRR